MSHRKLRKTTKPKPKYTKDKWEVDVSAVDDWTINNGDQITIAGVKMESNGEINYSCCPGEETVFTAKRVI